MNALTITGGAAVTMTSLELVEYINSQRGEGESELRHDHFMAKVPQVLGEIGAPKFRGTYRDVQNKERPCYTFPKREACLMAMSYSYDLQAKVFDKMTALEQQVAKPAFVLPDFTNPAIAARAWADQVEKVQELEIQSAETTKRLEAVQPKADALDLISTFAEGSMCITNAAKVLQKQPKKLFEWLQNHQWIYRRAGGSGFIGYQSRIQVGYLDHKVTTVERSDGTVKQVEQVLVTAKGLAKLATDLGVSQMLPI